MKFSFENTFKEIINSNSKIKIFFGKIVNKINDERLDYNIYNPIILKRLSSLYKFKIYNNDFLYSQINKDKLITDKKKVNFESNKICKEIHYIYMPNKSYDTMI